MMRRNMASRSPNCKDDLYVYSNETKKDHLRDCRILRRISIQALVDHRMEQANDALLASRVLIDADLSRDAISRAYYAIFYAVLALLVTRRLGTSKHSGALNLFNREFIKTGMLPSEMGKLARRAFDRRLEADYAELYLRDPRSSYMRMGREYRLEFIVRTRQNWA